MKIQYYIAKRLVLVAFVLFGISVITFFIARVVPSEPAARWIGLHATAEQIAAAKIELGLDKPLYIQYYVYIKNLFHGDWGISIVTHQPVLKDIKEYLPASLELIIVGMIIGVVIGIFFGVLSATRKDKSIDHICRFISIGGVSLPTFWLGIMLQLIFFREIGILPLSGRIDSTLMFTSPLTKVTGFYILDSIITGNWAAFKSSFAHIILPALTLSVYPMGLVTRMTRSSLIEVLNEDYIRVAKAYGISDRLIRYKYALKNAISPTITVLALCFAYTLTSTFLIEAVFNWPGLGGYTSRAILAMDYPAIMGVTLLVATFYVLINLLVDLIHAFIDPRIVLE